MNLKLTDASIPPNGDLVKEVYAHFGLCIFLSHVFETGMINILTALETASSKKPTRGVFDNLYAKHEKLTFGKLMKALKGHGLIPNDLMREMHQLKTVRNHLAHRFFRDHHLDFMSQGGCHYMIEILEAHQENFDAVDERVAQIQIQVLAKIGIDPEQFGAMKDHAIAQMLEEAHSRYRD